MKMSKTLSILSVMILFACGTVKLIAPTQADADRGAKKYGSMTLADLNRGKMIYEQNCNKCHSLKDPASKDEMKWGKIVPGMVKKVNNKAGEQLIDPQSQEVLLHYLVTMGTK
jgi:cytochrome c5